MNGRIDHSRGLRINEDKPKQSPLRKIGDILGKETMDIKELHGITFEMEIENGKKQKLTIGELLTAFKEQNLILQTTVSMFQNIAVHFYLACPEHLYFKKCDASLIEKIKGKANMIKLAEAIKESESQTKKEGE